MRTSATAAAEIERLRSALEEVKILARGELALSDFAEVAESALAPREAVRVCEAYGLALCVGECKDPKDCVGP